MKKRYLMNFFAVFLLALPLFTTAVVNSREAVEITNANAKTVFEALAPEELRSAYHGAAFDFGKGKKGKKGKKVTVTVTNDGCEPAVLWRLISKGKWATPAETTIQPGSSYTLNANKGQTWEVWNEADKERFDDFKIDKKTKWNFTTRIAEEEEPVVKTAVIRLMVNRPN